MPDFNPYHRFTGIFIPEGVYQCSELTLSAKFVYGRLIRYAGKNGVAFPKVSTLAEELCLSEGGVSKSLKKLKEFGLIRVEKGNPIRHEPNKYFFLEHACLGTEMNVNTGDDISSSPVPDISSSPLKDEESQLRESLEGKPPDNGLGSVRTGVDIDQHQRGFLTTVITLIEKRAERQFSKDARWLSRFRNDLGSLVTELKGNHDRIIKVLKWYSESTDCLITIDSGFTLKDKFSRIERLMNGPKDPTEVRREGQCKTPGIVTASAPKPWQCECGEWNSAIDNACKCGVKR